MNALHDKIALHGAESLTDVELLGVVLDDQVMAEQALESSGSLSALVTEELSRLRMVGGMGLRRAAQLHAAVELGRRLSSRDVLVSAEVSSVSTSVEGDCRPRWSIVGLSSSVPWSCYLRRLSLRTTTLRAVPSQVRRIRALRNVFVRRPRYSTYVCSTI